MISSRRSSSVGTPLPTMSSESVTRSRSLPQYPVDHFNSVATYYDQQWPSQSPRGSDHQWRGRSSWSSCAVNVPGWVWVSLGIFLVSLPWVQHSFIEKQWKTLTNEIHEFQMWEKRSVRDLHRQSSTLSNLEGTIRTMQNANDRLLVDMRMSRRQLNAVEETFSEMEALEDAYISNIDSLERHIQERSRTAVMKKFGQGPHRVEISVSPKLASSGLDQKTQYKFTVELAPLDVMPHSVHQFLRMVSEKMWDGLAFVHKARSPHVIQATPLEISSATRVNGKFEEAHLSRLAFSEYSSEFPHLQYTLGFSRKGPDFFVNTENNSNAHGPSSDDDYSDDAESCFGKIVSDRHVLDSLVQDSGDPHEVRVFEINHLRLL